MENISDLKLLQRARTPLIATISESPAPTWLSLLAQPIWLLWSLKSLFLFRHTMSWVCGSSTQEAKAQGSPHGQGQLSK